MNTLIRKMARVAIAAMCALGASSAPASTTSQIEWRFESAGTPATPDANTTAITGALAQVAPGEMSLGWKTSQPGLDGGSGLWDLGRSGSLRLNLPAANLRQITVQVRQWIDGFIYSDAATVTVPGAILKSTTQVEETTGPVGGWIVQKTVWEAAGGTISAVDVTGPATGSVIDNVAVVTAIAPVQPLVLSIQPTESADTVELSWPESAGNAVIESAADLKDPQGWSSLAESAQLANGRYSLVVPTGGSARYFRLKR